MGNYVIAGVGNYVIVNPSNLGNYVIADSHSTVQWKYEAPGTEPVQQTFTLSRVDPGSVLTTDDQHHPTADWRTCDQ